MVPLTAPLLGVNFLGEHISLKNWTQKVILRHDTITSFKRTCFLIRLKHVLGVLYVFNGLTNMPVLT
jgi:hypothetical protein